MAVDLAKVSLWLVTLAREHAFTFLDHALRCGDSLVGLTNKQILAMSWDISEDKALQPLLLDETLPDRIQQAANVRIKIAQADEGEYDELAEELKSASEYVNDLRLVGDSVVAAYFAGEKPKDRLINLAEVREQSKALFGKTNLSKEVELRGRLRSWSDWLKMSSSGAAAANAATGYPHLSPIVLAPFHWELEFPEVFSRPSHGFDVMIGNPPFLGGTRISTAYSKAYLESIVNSCSGSGDRADLVAYFFRRAYDCLGAEGALGLVATNTISQGDTRKTSLSEISLRGGIIFNATKRMQWPGQAAVIVSVVHISKGWVDVPIQLDGRNVNRITPFLFHTGPNSEPKALASNSSLSYNGVYPYGAGFQFDDGDERATPISVMNHLLSEDPRNAQVIFPYIGGEELLGDPTQTHRRYVISFGSRNHDEVLQWPALLAILEAKVKPERMALGGPVSKTPWWQFWRTRDQLLRGLKNRSRYLAHPFTATHLAFSFLPSTTLIASPHLAFLLSENSDFSVLQSRCHETWTRFFASTMKDDLRYALSDCFETFPFPPSCQRSSELEVAGKVYYEFRAALMVRHNEGLTKTYNRFHDPEERDPDILKLRELHAAMDRAVLDAYGWTDIPTDCEFILDYEEDEEEGAKSRKKKPWRYRWPDEVRDEVLARLLELNAQRAEEEELAGLTKKGKSSSRGVRATGTLGLLMEGEDV
jgi:hypothetical protein